MRFGDPFLHGCSNGTHHRRVTFLADTALMEGPVPFREVITTEAKTLHELAGTLNELSPIEEFALVLIGRPWEYTDNLLLLTGVNEALAECG